MKQTKKGRSLRLERETLRRLSVAELEHVIGGVVATKTCQQGGGTGGPLSAPER